MKALLKQSSNLVRRGFSKWKLQAVNEFLGLTPENTIPKNFDVPSQKMSAEVIDAISSVCRDLMRSKKIANIGERGLYGYVEVLLAILISREFDSEIDHLTLRIEQEIDGTVAHGPVEFVVMYRQLSILLTEVKKSDWLQALAQNMMQLFMAYWSNREPRVPVYGCMTNGFEYEFLMYDGTKSGYEAWKRTQRIGGMPDDYKASVDEWKKWVELVGGKLLAIITQEIKIVKDAIANYKPAEKKEDEQE